LDAAEHLLRKTFIENFGEWWAYLIRAVKDGGRGNIGQGD
jgi:hypothetical protein